MNGAIGSKGRARCLEKACAKPIRITCVHCRSLQYASCTRICGFQCCQVDHPGIVGLLALQLDGRL